MGPEKLVKSSHYLWRLPPVNPGGKSFGKGHHQVSSSKPLQNSRNAQIGKGCVYKEQQPITTTIIIIMIIIVSQNSNDGTCKCIHD